MTTLGHLIRKEILNHLLGLRFQIVGGLGALIVALSLLDGAAYHRRNMESYGIAQAATQELRASLYHTLTREGID